ncbi:hypothetical protein R5R35_001587 [Gryllus longicercus]|uniref:Uncharacterized protein n=1 Tax=Gryllus longicercus TaxID=2509291 RepID=A0AAN9WWW8_9ORTH
MAAGADSGLSFSIRVPLCHVDFECTDALQGHTVTLHSPTVVPWTRDRSFRVPLAGATKARVQPHQMATDPALRRKYSAAVRRCIFPEERALAFFAHYTQSNCERECLANFTLAWCGCVPFFMHRK